MARGLSRTLAIRDYTLIENREVMTYGEGSGYGEENDLLTLPGIGGQFGGYN